MRTTKRIAAAAAIVSALTMTAACGGGGSSSDSGDSGSKSAAPSSKAAAPSSSAAADPAADLVGPGCAAYAKQVPNGSGSVKGMAADPVAVAASNNPLLKTLTAAVSGKHNPKVNLVDTLNGGKFTVFAPVDSAFAKLPKPTLKLLEHPEGRQGAADRADLPRGRGPDVPRPDRRQDAEDRRGREAQGLRLGRHAQGAEGERHLRWRKTANATVYLIDSVMMPPSMG